MLTYRMQYLKKLKKFNLKFLISLGFDVFAIKLNFIVLDITLKFYDFIVILVIKILGILEVLYVENY